MIDLESLANDNGLTTIPSKDAWRWFVPLNELAKFANAVLEEAAKQCESDAAHRVSWYDGELIPNSVEGRLRAGRVRALKLRPVK